MGRYRVIVEERALKSLKQIPNPYKSNIFEKIKLLESVSDRTANIKKLRNYPDGYRLRVGDYRILFVKDEKSKFIKVYQVGHRKEIYK